MQKVSGEFAATDSLFDRCDFYGCLNADWKLFHFLLTVESSNYVLQFRRQMLNEGCMWWPEEYDLWVAILLSVDIPLESMLELS